MMEKIICRFSAILTGFVLLCVDDCQTQAQEAIAPSPAVSYDEDAARYRTAAPRIESRAIAFEKARFRAEQRMARQASLKWYGFSASRPTASGIPWTTMYSPAWAMPGGRPFGWYLSSRPLVIINGGAAMYR